MITERERDLLIETYGNPTFGDCDNCDNRSVVVWEIADRPFCSSECALEGLQEWDSTSFEEYLNDIRLKGNLIDVYDRSRDG